MKNKGEKGSFTVEAILSLSIFMFAFVTIVSLATVAKIESTTQYAIDQTAKEISKYTYIASRANLLVHPKDSAEATVDSIDEAVQSMYDFSDVLSSSTGGNGVTLNSEGLSDMLSGMSGDDFKSITASAQNVYNSFAPLMSDPKGAITALAQVVAQKGGSALVSRVIAQPLCKALLPKYITQQDDASAVLEKMGVVNGLDGLDFSLSTFLMDQRTINVVLVYEIDVKGFGIFDQKLIVKQTASTAAWLADTEGVKLSDVASKTSAWQKSDMERGKDYVSELQGENPHQGVKNGVGVDLYDQDSNTFTAVHSMNVFAASYSDYVRSGDGTKASDYILKREKIKAALKAYRLTFYSEDAAGNIAENTLDTKKQEIGFGVDKTKPNMVVTNLESDTTYPLENLTVSLSAGDNLLLQSVVVYLDDYSKAYKTWTAEEVAAIVANQGEFTFDIPGDSTGAHQVKIVCTDAAGNEQTEEITNFYVTTNLFVRYYNNKPLFFGSIAAVVVIAGVVIALAAGKKKKNAKANSPLTRPNPASQPPAPAGGFDGFG